MQSQARTVDEYLRSLPPDRREAISAVRDVIRRNLDREYEEGMQYGMIGYYVPHSLFPAGYHCDPRQPLGFAGLASQKNHMAIYLMAQYVGDREGKRFRAAYEAAGKKLDMGKSCIRFKKLDELALDVIGDAIRRMPARAWIEYYKSEIDVRNKGGGFARAASASGTQASRKATSSGRKSAAAGASAKTKKKIAPKVSRARASRGSPSSSRGRSSRPGRG